MEHFFKAASYSRDGLLFMLKETAFRQELLLIVITLPCVGALKGAKALCDVLPWTLLVLIVEALNTGIEKTVDLCTSERHPLAKAAKDCGSFACGTAIAAFVFVCARTLFFS